MRIRPRRTALGHVAQLTVLAIGMCFAISAASAASYGTIPPTPWGVDSAAGRCVVCHSLEKGGPFRYAPNLYGIVGASKAREEGYGYSLSLMTKGGVWTEDDLDQFLADAGKFAPGSTKSIRVRDAEERRKIIEFLKSPSQ